LSKETAKKATFEDLLKKKIQREKDRYKTIDIYVVSMDAIMTFKKPKDQFIFNVVDDIQNSEDTEKMVEAFKKLIYQCCEMLQNPELQNKLGVVDPFDTVDALFDLGEIMSIGEQLADFIDVQGKVEKIKN
jgi:uncharacterized membrane-anchored protein YjiN (DUF445 family)